MKVAVASEGQNVSGHFGHCESFTIYEVEAGKVLSKEIKPSPGHRPGYLPLFLNDLGVNVIIAGGMGETAQQLFNENEIEAFVGVQGLCDEAIQHFVAGELKSTGSICREHQYEGHCNE
jgi:predicted Fe-Mo cluster-binding NifX family protein